MPKQVPFDIISPAAKAAQVLRQEIREGKYAVGERLDNERTLAERFDVSRGTIRKSMEILERERLISRQQGRGTFIANPTFAPTPGTSQSALIGAIVSDKVDYFAALLRAASSQATSRGYVLTTGANVLAEEEAQHVEALIRSGVRGVLLTPRPFSMAAYQRLQKAGLPIVLVDTRLAGVDEDFVSVDDRRGTVLATNHLIELGHRQLGYIGHPYAYDIPCRPDRVGGFRDACIDAGLEVKSDWMLELRDADYAPAMKKLLTSRERPTGVVAFNDDWALRLITIARSVGLEVPRDLSVVGFDNSPASRLYDTPVTSVDPECAEIGIAASNLVIEKVEKPRKRAPLSIRIAPRLVIRESTRKIPNR
jgi:GntR family transcriptional regulator of arabinose operon